MNQRRLAFASIAVVVVLCVIGVAILAVAAGGSALAYEVNGSRTSQRTVDGQLDELASAKGTKQASMTPGSIDSRATAQVLTLSIARDVMRDVAEQRGVKVTASDRAQAKAAIGSQLDQYPPSYRDLVLDLRAHAYALGVGSDDALNAFLARQFARADVQVNSKYGIWNPRVGVCPPTGCSTAGSASGSSG
jgi:hypothetical protein